MKKTDFIEEVKQ